jgi:valyl-tRNA synthetase
MTSSPFQPFSPANQGSNSSRIPDEALDDYSNIEASLSNPENGTTWGFAVYRCTYGNERQWQRMVQLIQTEVQDSLTLNRRPDLLVGHQAIFIEDAARLNGATSHIVRDHFQSWVENQLDAQNGSAGCESPAAAADLELKIRGLAPRYNFCLFVDEICLESLDYMSMPVVKVLCRFSGVRGENEREYTVYPKYEDGETEEDEEAVGWMYREVVDYCGIYFRLMEAADWYEEYVRPPGLMFCDEDGFPGFWRKMGIK